MSKYDKLPNAPEEVSAANVLVRIVDGLGFRYATATHDLRPDFINFKACETAMSMGEVLKHVYWLAWWVNGAFKLEENEMDKTLDTIDAYREATLLKYEQLSNYLSTASDADLLNAELYSKRKDMHLPFWYAINGPIADALTHVGQINSWRRMADNPVARISPLDGKART